MSEIIILNPGEQLTYYHKQMKNALDSNEMKLFEVALHKALDLQKEIMENNRKQTEILLQKAENNLKINELQLQENDEMIKQHNYKKCLRVVRS